MKLVDGFFTSGWKFNEHEWDIKNRFQMLNVALLLSAIAFIFGIIVNVLNGVSGLLIPLESVLLITNSIMFVVLRNYRNSFEFVSTFITAQCTLLLLVIIYTNDPDTMKHTWLFTYLIVLLYFQKRKNGIYWLVFLLIMIMVAPFQSFIEVKFSIFQTFYVLFVLVIVSAIVYFYQVKMYEASEVIEKQKTKLHSFNEELEKQVKQKTLALREVNETLEVKVQEKIQELVDKDKMMSLQSKQAVMGEMIIMIAHQWRQPLSTITLQISNLQFKTLLAKKLDDKELDQTLSEISDSIMYLSQTIDDFQTYFHPAKDLEKIEMHKLLQRAINFTLPRVKEQGIEIILLEKEDFVIHTHINELIQVILNIMNNAIDALNSSTNKNLAVVVSAQGEKEKIIIAIKDNGPGISEENIPHIFEPYFSTKGKNGTGLGLYMSQMIIEKQFNGEILVQSSKEGTIFSVVIPKKI